MKSKIYRLSGGQAQRVSIAIIKKAKGDFSGWADRRSWPANRIDIDLLPSLVASDTGLRRMIQMFERVDQVVDVTQISGSLEQSY